MFERVGIENRIGVKMKDDEELEMLLDEIPHATCFNLHHPHNSYDCDGRDDHDRPSNVKHKMGGNWYEHSCVSPVSGFSLKSDGGSSSSLLSGGSPTPSPLEEVKSLFLPGNSASVNRFRIDPCELNLSRNFSRMCINEEPESGHGGSFQSHNHSNGNNLRLISDKCWSFHNSRKGFSGFGALASSSPGLIGGQVASPVVQSLVSGINSSSSTIHSHLHQIGSYADEDSSSVSKAAHIDLDSVFYSHQAVSNGRYAAHSSAKMPMRNLEALDQEDSLIVQAEQPLKYGIGNGYRRLGRPQEKRPQMTKGVRECGLDERMHFPVSLPLKLSSLGEAKGYIYHIAKDQHGCRFLQRMFDEGTPQDVQIIFNEIIDHAVELMMNPFGNYLMQKLLEVCNEEQRMEILLKVTEEPGQLVRISLNTHGTRVVQKLIETLKTRQQISLVISSLEPGFLALIKDLNGNHVIQRCLQYLTNGDSKFIFVAAAKYCVDIATHQHGCCVLQRCIAHAIGQYRESLIAEISANGLLLAQDAFGNYVVQFILELKIPSATSELISRFEGNFVHLSTQKFSSHVVEKCLIVCDYNVQSKIIHELISATHFEQLLQDPHANYVVQTALRVSEGCLHSSLMGAIESHKEISRNSPYSKRIFSNKLWKK